MILVTQLSIFRITLNYKEIMYTVSCSIKNLIKCQLSMLNTVLYRENKRNRVNIPLNSRLGVHLGIILARVVGEE